VKKALIASLAALVLLLVSQQQAYAWKKWSFNAGISINYEGGNNSFLWGLYQNGQVPGYPSDYYPLNRSIVSGPSPYGGFPAYGGAPLAADYSGGHGPALPAGAQPMPSGNQSQQPKQAETQAVYYNNYNYQPAGYQTPSYGYSNYGYSNYGNYQVPSYWYGR
jgi:hypothetical protein